LEFGRAEWDWVVASLHGQVLGSTPFLVFDRRNELHFPLTVFGGEATKRTSSGTVRQYLNVLIPFFDWLEAGQSDRRVHRSWDDPPETIRQGISEYLVERLKCKVREHRVGFQLVSLTSATRTTVRVFLSALKLYYRVMQVRNYYKYANPLVDGISAMLTRLKIVSRRMPNCLVSQKSVAWWRPVPSTASRTVISSW
jgi:hypothetical protein